MFDVSQHGRAVRRGAKAIRSRKGPVRTDRRPPDGRLCEVPRQQGLPGPHVRLVRGLPPRAAPPGIRTGLHEVPHDRHVEDPELRPCAHGVPAQGRPRHRGVYGLPRQAGDTGPPPGEGVPRLPQRCSRRTVQAGLRLLPYPGDVQEGAVRTRHGDSVPTYRAAHRSRLFPLPQGRGDRRPGENDGDRGHDCGEVLRPVGRLRLVSRGRPSRRRRTDLRQLSHHHRFSGTQALHALGAAERIPVGPPCGRAVS